MKAFFDESCKTPVDGPALFMAGFAGTALEWTALSDAWAAGLHESPFIEYFKFNESTSLTGQFSRWKKEDAKKKRLALAKVIARFPSVTGFCVFTLHAAFAERDRDAVVLKQRPSRAYDWAFVTTLSLVMGYMDRERPGDDGVDFVFDKCSEFKQCRSFFYRTKEDPVLGPLFLNRAKTCNEDIDEQVMALQMADLLAGECAHLRFKIKTEPLHVIETSNRVLFGDGTPPSHMQGVFRSWKMASDLEKMKAKLSKFVHTTDFVDEEVEERIGKLIELNSIFEDDWARTAEGINNDPNMRLFEEIKSRLEDSKKE